MKPELIPAMAVFIAVYGFVVRGKVNRGLVSVIGACSLVFIGALSQEAALSSIDFNAIGLLVAMMAIVTITGRTGIFQYLAIRAARLAGGEPKTILILLSLITAVISAFLDNITTVLLTVPVTFLIADELGLDSFPFITAQILSSNIGGTATLIGDPPNIMIGSAAGLTFLDFILNTGVITPLIMAVTLVPIIIIYRKELKVTEDVRERIMGFNEHEALKDIKLLKKCVIVIAAVLAAFVFQRPLDIGGSTISLLGAAVLVFISGEDLNRVIEKTEWTSIFFLIGLFVVVHGLVSAGVIGEVSATMLRFTGNDMGKTGIAVLWTSAVVSAITDNIPLVAAMIPLIKGLAGPLGGKVMPLWWALSLGACLGGNGTLIGASANIVVAGMAERSGRPIGFIRFTLLAFPLMLLSVGVCTAYMYLRYFR